INCGACVHLWLGVRGNLERPSHSVLTFIARRFPFVPWQITSLFQHSSHRNTHLLRSGLVAGTDWHVSLACSTDERLNAYYLRRIVWGAEPIAENAAREGSVENSFRTRPRCHSDCDVGSSDNAVACS